MARVVSLASGLILTFATLGPGGAWAAGNRAWVSGHGVDQVGCGAPTSPCRSLQYALDNAVVPGGEIDILDPAGYGTVAISQAVSIVNDGVGTAGVQASSGIAIAINAGPGDAVFLKGLNIDGEQQGGTLGVVFNSGRELVIVDCVIRHFSGDGVLIEPTTGAVRVLVADSLLADNGSNGLIFEPQSGPAAVALVLDRVTALSNGVGVNLDGSHAQLDATVADTVASENDSYGVAVGSSGATAHLTVDSSVIDHNGIYGLVMQTGSVTHLSRSVLDQNGAYGAFAGASGVFRSTGDNRILGNVTGAILGPGPTADVLK